MCCCIIDGYNSVIKNSTSVVSCLSALLEPCTLCSLCIWAVTSYILKVIIVLQNLWFTEFTIFFIRFYLFSVHLYCLIDCSKVFYKPRSCSLTTVL